MEYLVLIIYVVIIGEFIHSKPIAQASSVRRGHKYYKVSGIINIIAGIIGMFAINTLLRDKGIISQEFVWIGLIGSGITMMYGCYCICRMMFTLEP